MPENWLDTQHDEYTEMEPRRKLARRHYQADPHEIREKDLIQREQGESFDQFEERRATSDYFPAFATVVDSYAGQIRQADVTRQWSVEEGEEGGISDDTRDRLLDDTDGHDTNWLSMLGEVVVTLISENVVWGLVEGMVRDEDGNAIAGPHVKVISPKAVLDWGRDEAGLSWVKVKHKPRVGKTPRSKGEKRERYAIYYRDGWELWEKQQKASESVAVLLTDRFGNERRPYGTRRDGTDNAFRYKARGREAETLPIFRVDLALKRYVGYTLADRNVMLFNKESERDNILRIANTPKGVYAGHMEDLVELTKKIKSEDIVSNLWNLAPDARQKHYYMAPPIESADIASEVLMEKIETFFVSAFQFYENSVRGTQKTATEIEQDASKGEWSFLNTVATGRDEFENAALWRLEQIEWPDEPDRWGQAFAETPKSFKPVDAQVRGRELARTFFGVNAVPVGDTGRANAAKEIAEIAGIDVDDAEVEREVRERSALNGQATALEREVLGGGA